MKKSVSILEAFAIVVIAVLLSILLLLPLTAYIVMDIANLFNVTLITAFPKETIYGLLLLISLLTHKYKNDDEENKNERPIVTLTITYIQAIGTLLISWGMAYLIHMIKF